MPYKIINASLHHQHALKRRTATRMYMEPLVAGKRLMLRQSVIISDEQYAINKADIDQYVKDGIVTVEPQVVSSINPDVTKIEFDMDEPKEPAVTNPPEDVSPPFLGETYILHNNEVQPPTAPPPPPVQSSPSPVPPQRRDDKKRTR